MRITNIVRVALLLSTTLAAVPANAITLWASSSEGTNPSSIFTVDTATGAATLVGSSTLGNKISAVAVDPMTGTLYGIRGSSCSGARLITIDTQTGAGTVVGVLVGEGFDATDDTGGGIGGGGSCNGGSDALVFGADGTLYAGGWNAGFSGGTFLTLDKSTGAVLSVQPTVNAASISGLARAADGSLWASRGSNGQGVLHRIDPGTGQFTSTLALSDATLVLSDIAFGPNGVLYGSVPNLGQLVSIDTTTGTVTVIGSFGGGERISGLAPRAEVLAATCTEPGGCQLGGQIIQLPPGLVIPEGTTISQLTSLETDPRVAAGTCGMEALTLYGGNDPKPDLIIPEYICASLVDGKFAVLEIESDLTIPDGTVDVETDPAAYLQNTLPCHEPLIPAGIDPTRGQDISFWQPTDAADVLEGHGIEITNGCGSSRGKTKGLSYFVVGMHIDCGIDGLQEPQAARQCLIDLTKVKLHFMMRSIVDSRSALSRREFKKIALVGGIASVAFHLRYYDLASRKLELLIKLVEAANYDPNVAGNPRGDTLMRAFNAKFMTDVKVIGLQN